MCRSIKGGRRLALLAWLAGAWASPFAASGAAQTPAYITAKPDAAARVFGGEIARKIFSNAYTPARQQAVLRSQKAIPGFDCSPRTIRSFLLILDGERPRILELLPGATNTDPLLQRDALKGATAFAAAASPAGCEKRTVADTRIVSKIERGAPWVERWVYHLYGAQAEVELTFTPSDRGGTTWGAKLVK